MQGRGVLSGDPLSYANGAVFALFADEALESMRSPVLIDFFENTGDRKYESIKVQGDEMAKTHHRIFEMFDFAEEAKCALASKAALKTNTDDPQKWPFRHLVASHLAGGIVHVKFKETELLGSDTVRELRNDFSELAGMLVNGSRVLLDFEGMLDIGTESIAELANFNRKLQAKGSRIVLCNLNPAVQASFFPNRNKNEDI